MADEDNEAPAAPVAAETAGGGEQSHAHFKLLAFSPENPSLWFAQVECVLANRNINREFNKYCLVVEALSHDSLRLVTVLIKQVPAADPYTTLKRWLLSAHQLTDFQQAEALFNMTALGSRKLDVDVDGGYAGSVSQGIREVHPVPVPVFVQAFVAAVCAAG
jgi:hypothetical protein